jgi:2-polyprenyl-3-methyl-5-hydroxy-6-metoxy-1,4-benzoquinol methylase
MVKSDIAIIRDKCPLCDSKDFRFLFVKHGFDHVICSKCDLIFTLQIIDESKLKYMESGKEGDLYGELKEDSTLSDFDRQKFEIVFEELEKYSKIKNIFDFGSQLGSFLDWAREKYSVIGHEYHTPLRKMAQRKGHTILSDNLAEIKLDQEFDLITCWDYLDHVTNPKETIKNLTKYLKKGGLFFFAINNRDSLSARMMHADSPMFIGPHHTMHYGINQLKLLMKDYEFLYSYSYVSELNWISNWLNFKNPEFGDASLMFDLLDPKKITQLGMGIKVNAAFRKQ